jgi:hypothetical protein
MDNPQRLLQFFGKGGSLRIRRDEDVVIIAAR